MSDHRVICGDCLDPVTGLASLPDKSVDHVITDPPYSEHVHAKSMRNNAEGKVLARPVLRDLGFGSLTDAVMVKAAQHFARLTRRWVLVFCATEQVTTWVEALQGEGLEHVRVGVWLKRAATPQFTGDRPANGVETVVIAHQPGRKRWNGGGHHAVWEATVAGKNHIRHHTTEKPVDLMEALVRDFTDEGETVLDPFAGSGTTGVAAKRLGRKFMGWERDEKYWRIATKRIENAREQMRLFEVAP